MASEKLIDSGESVVFSLPFKTNAVALMTVENSKRLWRLYLENYIISVIHSDTVGKNEAIYRKKTLVPEARYVGVGEPGEITVQLKPIPANLSVLHINPEWMNREGDKIMGRGNWHFKPEGVVHDAMFRQFARLFDAIKAEADSLTLESLLSSCLYNVFSVLSETPPLKLRQASRQFVRRARDFIHANWLMPITLADLERETGLSKYHLIRSFSAQYGMPPHQYLLHLRLANARLMLATGKEPETLTFADQSHFIRHFKRVIGITPNVYTRQFRTRTTIPL